MAGGYSIQFHDRADKEPMREKVFEGFRDFYVFLSTSDRNGPDAINVRLPAGATEAERQQIRNLGFQAN
jgi:hypothetical protein